MDRSPVSQFLGSCHLSEYGCFTHGETGFGSGLCIRLNPVDGGGNFRHDGIKGPGGPDMEGTES
jgi:hypothetical protein